MDARGGYYQLAHDTGLIATETPFLFRTPGASLNSDALRYFGCVPKLAAGGGGHTSDAMACGASVCRGGRTDDPRKTEGLDEVLQRLGGGVSGQGGVEEDGSLLFCPVNDPPQEALADCAGFLGTAGRCPPAAVGCAAGTGAVCIVR